MWFAGVEVEQGTSAPPPKKKILDLPLSPFNVYFVNHQESRFANFYRVFSLTWPESMQIY